MPTRVEGRRGRDGAASARALRPEPRPVPRVQRVLWPLQEPAAELTLFVLLSCTAILESLSSPKGTNPSVADFGFFPTCSSPCSVRKVVSS